MFKKITVLVAAFVLVLSQVAFAVAKTPEASMSPSELPETINSFELFWPIAPGKTMGDSLYFLKTLKENARGMIIFGNPEKADYKVLLATKRLVEAEKLITENKEDLANKTLNSAVNNLEAAQNAVSSAVENKDDFQGNGQTLSDKLKNIDLFARWLASKNEGKYESLKIISEKAVQTSNRLEGK